MKKAEKLAYAERFKTSWSEQVMLACDRFAKECCEANKHNDEGDVSTLTYALNEILACLWNEGFQPSHLKLCIEDAVHNSYLERSDRA